MTDASWSIGPPATKQIATKSNLVAPEPWPAPPPVRKTASISDTKAADIALADKALAAIEDKTLFSPNWLNKPWEPYVPEKIVSYRDPIEFCSLGGYRWFSSYWWKDVLSYPFYDFWRDCRTFYLRGRYGWAPRDTWNLENYLARTFAGTLNHLADHTHGVPANYPTGPHPMHHIVNDDASLADTSFVKWQKDLRRWAKTFDDYYDWTMNSRELVYNVQDKKGMKALIRKEKATTNDITKTFKEIGPWFRALWD